MTSSIRSWQSLVPGAFAGMTAPFGIHPNDNKRATRMFHAALRAGATLDDVVNEASAYLAKQGFSSLAIPEELQRIKSFTPNPWPRFE